MFVVGNPAGGARTGTESLSTVLTSVAAKVSATTQVEATQFGR